jgi:tetratricopeptide (TPR) repeat protein
MNEQSVIEVQQIVRDGRAAALAGDSFTARNLFRRAVDLDPEFAEAWLGLSSVVPVLAEKRDYLQKTLALDPNNSEALASLAYVEKLISEGMQLAPSQRRAEQRASGNASPLLSTPEPMPIEAVAMPQVEYCYIHTDRETGLKCTNCGKPICGECARSASVGQLCPACRKARRPINYQVSATNLAVAGVIALVGMSLVSFILLLFGGFGFLFLIIAFFLATLFASGLQRLLDLATRNKRGREMQITVGIAMACGALPWLVMTFSLVLLLFTVVAIVAMVRFMK